MLIVQLRRFMNTSSNWYKSANDLLLQERNVFSRKYAWLRYLWLFVMWVFDSLLCKPGVTPIYFTLHNCIFGFTWFTLFSYSRQTSLKTILLGWFIINNKVSLCTRAKAKIRRMWLTFNHHLTYLSSYIHNNIKQWIPSIVSIYGFDSDLTLSTMLAMKLLFLNLRDVWSNNEPARGAFCMSEELRDQGELYSNKCVCTL